jgi:hypothetical protein
MLAMGAAAWLLYRAQASEGEEGERMALSAGLCGDAAAHLELIARELERPS